MKKRNLERMRYQSDTLASGLCITAIVCDMVYFVALYSNPVVVPGYRIGIDVILNILFMLVAFLASEEAKVYSRGWSFGMMLLAAIQAVRSFWLPEHYRALEQLTGGAYFITRTSLIASAALMLAAGIVSYVNSTALKNYLNGLEA